MSLPPHIPSPKELKKLADACRKSGITSFEGGGIKFTLSDIPPVSSYKKAKGTKAAPSAEEAFESDSLSQEDLMFWSVGVAEEAATEDSKAE